LSLLYEDGCGEVTSFYVDPPYQGYGVGIALWDAGLKRLQEYDCQDVWVWVLEQAPARIFYEHRGCTEREEGTYRIGKHAEVALGYWRVI
jgi:ribosomal protein S18 acetylase RimI-like enzyme